MKRFELRKLDIHEEATAGRIGFGIISLAFLYEAGSGMTAESESFNCAVLCLLSGAALIGVLARWGHQPPERAVVEGGTAAASASAGHLEPESPASEPLRKEAAVGLEERRRRLTRASHRRWTRADGFTLAGGIELESSWGPY